MARKGSTSDTFGTKSRYISPIELIEVIEKMDKQKSDLHLELARLYEAIRLTKDSKLILKAQKIVNELLAADIKYENDYETKSNKVKNSFRGRTSVNGKPTKEFNDYCNNMHCTKINTLVEEVKAAKLAIKKIKALG